MFTAFNPDAVGLFVFPMGIMLHPLVSVSIASVAMNLSRIINSFIRNKGILGSKGILSKIWKRIAPFTMILFFGFISAFQFYLQYNWSRYKQDKINENCRNETTASQCEKQFFTKNEFGKKQYDQCSCTDAVCEIDHSNLNLEDIFLQSLSSNFNAYYCFFGYTIGMVLFYIVIETIALSTPIPMLEFIIGPKKKNSQNEPSLAMVQEMANKAPKKQKTIKKTLNSMAFIFGIIFLICIVLIPLYDPIYQNLSEFKSCPPGQYDSSLNANKIICDSKFFHKLKVM